MIRLQFIICMVALMACNSDDISTVCDTNVIKDIPEKDKDSADIAMKQKIFTLANIQDISQGFNESQIRIWFGYSADIENLLIFEKVNGDWAGTYNKLQYNYDETADSLQSVNRVSKKISPKSGWQPFVDSLYKLGFRELPDMSRISGYDTNRDGNWFTVEYADCKTYKVYRYQDPWDYKNKFLQAKQVTEICLLLERQFDFSRLGKVPF